MVYPPFKKKDFCELVFIFSENNIKNFIKIIFQVRDTSLANPSFLFTKRVTVVDCHPSCLLSKFYHFHNFISFPSSLNLIVITIFYCSYSKPDVVVSSAQYCSRLVL